MDNSTEKAYLTALHFIKYRPRSEFEIRNKLKSKNFSEEEINSVIQRLVQEGLINDEFFVKAWIRERFFNKRLGIHKIRQELLGKGISKDLISDILENEINPADAIENAVEFLRYKFSKITEVPDSEKLFQVLLRKGYSCSEAREATKLFIAEKQ